MGDAPIFDRYTKAKTVAFMNIEKKEKVMCVLACVLILFSDV